MSQNCHIGKPKTPNCHVGKKKPKYRVYTEAEYYEDKRIAQNAIKDKLTKAKLDYAEAKSAPYLKKKQKHYTLHELHDMRVEIQKLEGQWLDAGNTGD